MGAMDDNTKHQYNLIEKQSEDIIVIKVTLARIEFKLACIDDVKKKSDDLEKRIDCLEQKDDKKAAKWWRWLVEGIAVMGLTLVWNYLFRK